MRGKVAKQLRQFAKTDSEELPWVLYKDVQQSTFSSNKTVRLHNCGKAYYKLLKRIWKTVK